MYLNEEESYLVELYEQADINSFSANPTKWWNTLKQFVGNSRRIVLVCLAILWGWSLKC